MTALTQGAHHIGLTVSHLDASAGFFTSLLGWKEVKRDTSYPAIFVTDGSTMVTLWQARAESPVEFDKNHNVGLHHIAFKVESELTLNQIYEAMQGDENVSIEFAPEMLKDGPAQHMMVYEPSGIRVEFIWPGE